jgi:hypothetical protein
LLTDRTWGHSRSKHSADFDVTQMRASAQRTRDPGISEEEPNPWRTDSLQH